MKPATREWVRCAEEDFDVAAALLRRRTRTAANSIGFHTQQCVEKYFKARLEEAGLSVPKTHDLVALLQLLLPLVPLWASFAPTPCASNGVTGKIPTCWHIGLVGLMGRMGVGARPNCTREGNPVQGRKMGAEK